MFNFLQSVSLGLGCVSHVLLLDGDSGCEESIGSSFVWSEDFVSLELVTLPSSSG